MNCRDAQSLLRGIANKHAPAKKRKTGRQHAKEARDELLNEILAEMRDKKRSIPKDWERGFMSAMSVVEGKR